MGQQTTNLLLQRWDDIPFLLAVLRAGSFTGAATLLKTEQSTVSRRISALEEELGVTLFERGARAPTPTPTALSLRVIAEQIEAEVGRFADTAVDEDKRPVMGRVRVALTEEMAVHFVVPYVLPELRAKYPQLYVDLVTGYRAADLMAHEADIALRFFRSSRGDLVGKKVGEMPTGILCSRSRLRALKKRALHDLPWTVVELEGGSTPEAQVLDRLLREPPALSCTGYQVQLAAIRAGLGVGIGPTVVARLDPDLALLPSADLDLPCLELFLFTRRAIRNQPRVATVYSALEQRLGKLLSA